MGRLPGSRSLDASSQFPHERVRRQHGERNCRGSIDAPCDCLIDTRPSRRKLTKVTRAHSSWPQYFNVARQPSILDLFNQRRAQGAVDHHYKRRSARPPALLVFLPQRVESLQGRSDVRRHDRLAARLDLDVRSPCRRVEFDVLVTLDHHGSRADLP